MLCQDFAAAISIDTVTAGFLLSLQTSGLLQQYILGHCSFEMLRHYPPNFDAFDWI